jgi:hypothetical protein
MNKPPRPKKKSNFFLVKVELSIVEKQGVSS